MLEPVLALELSSRDARYALLLSPDSRREQRLPGTAPCASMRQRSKLVGLLRTQL
jgi:hypothetical protein